jgi:hypothetical protein
MHHLLRPRSRDYRAGQCTTFLYTSIAEAEGKEKYEGRGEILLRFPGPVRLVSGIKLVKIVQWNFSNEESESVG